MYINIHTVLQSSCLEKIGNSVFFWTVTDPASCRVITQSLRADAGRQRQQRQPSPAAPTWGSAQWGNVMISR